MTGTAAARLVEQTVGVVPEATYEVSAWIETAATTLGAQRQYRVRNDTGADLGLTTVATVTGTNAYTHYRQSFVTPANAATLTVRLHLPAGDSGRAFFDDVRLRPPWGLGPSPGGQSIDVNRPWPNSGLTRGRPKGCVASVTEAVLPFSMALERRCSP